MEPFKIVIFIILITLWLYVMIQPIYQKRIYKRKNKLFIDSLNNVMYVSPGSKTTDREIKDLISHYGDCYLVKLVDKNTIIKGINTYTIDYRKDKPNKG